MRSGRSRGTPLPIPVWVVVPRVGDSVGTFSRCLTTHLPSGPIYRSPVSLSDGCTGFLSGQETPQAPETTRHTSLTSGSETTSRSIPVAEIGFLVVILLFLVPMLTSLTQISERVFH